MRNEYAVRTLYEDNPDPEQFFCVYGWMLDYRLPGTILSVYALIYSFSSKHGWGCCYYSGQAMAKRLRLDPAQISKAIKYLRSVGLIRDGEAPFFEGQNSFIAVRLPLREYLAAAGKLDAGSASCRNDKRTLSK